MVVRQPDGTGVFFRDPRAAEAKLLKLIASSVFDPEEVARVDSHCNGTSGRFMGNFEGVADYGYPT
jgi:hypothetical protein